MNAAELAKPAIASVREGRTTFVPKNWEKTYFEWMENIQPWCISSASSGGATRSRLVRAGRQGLRRRERSRGEGEAAAHYGADTALTRDEDVLDTWFSSALWPFSDARLAGRDGGAEALLPDQRAGHRLRHHLLLGRPDDDDGPPLHGDRALQRLYIHALVRDEKGAKMSKSKGNVIAIPWSSSTNTRGCAALHARRHGRAGPRHQLATTASAATATSPPSSGTPFRFSQ